MTTPVVPGKRSATRDPYAAAVLICSVFDAFLHYDGRGVWVPAFARLRGDDKRRLQNKPAEVAVLGEVADVLVNVGGVDLDALAVLVGRDE